MAVSRPLSAEFGIYLTVQVSMVISFKSSRAHLPTQHTKPAPFIRLKHPWDETPFWSTQEATSSCDSKLIIQIRLSYFIFTSSKANHLSTHPTIPLPHWMARWSRSNSDTCRSSRCAPRHSEHTAWPLPSLQVAEYSHERERCWEHAELARPDWRQHKHFYEWLRVRSPSGSWVLR